MQQVKNYITNFLYAYSSLLFIRSRLVGVILCAVSFININIAVLGIIALFTAFVFAKFIHVHKDEIITAIYGYNSLLIGFAIGYLYKISLLSILMTCGTSILTFLLSYTIYSIFSTYLRVPVLNIPFTISSTIIYLASIKYSSLFVDSFYIADKYNLQWLPLSLQGLFRSAGLIIFQPYDIIGIIILTALLLFSRITFSLAVVSYFTGIIFLAMLKGNLDNAFLDYSAFNFMLIGIALGGIYLIPAKRTYLLALIGVILSVFVIDAAAIFWSNFQIPVFTLPFNLIVILFIYVLGTSRYHRMNLFIKASPESSLLNYLNNTRRFDRITPKPNLPFFGEWKVYQGFNGQWTHKGFWKHALDFVIVGSDGKSYQNQGLEKEDYYCFDKPVIAPINGYIVEFYDGFPDNKIGEVDKKHNWGNFIIIQADFGYFVEISHLKQGSVSCKIGDYVYLGSVIASCGNSGYAPEPHIHMQVQYLPKLGSSTIPFLIGNAKNCSSGLLIKNDLKTDEIVMPVTESKRYAKILQFILDEKFKYDFYHNGKLQYTTEIKVLMAADGSYYFTTTAENEKLYFGQEGNKFVFYSLEAGRKSILKYFFAALAGLILSDDENLSWEEYIPDNVFKSRWSNLLLKSFWHNLFACRAHYSHADKNTITGEIYAGKQMLAKTVIKLDENMGFAFVSCDTGKNIYELRLVD